MNRKKPPRPTQTLPGPPSPLHADKQYSRSILDEFAEPEKATIPPVDISVDSMVPPTARAEHWTFDVLWTERLHKMAVASNQTPQQFLESLLRRAWTGMPLRMR